MLSRRSFQSLKTIAWKMAAMQTASSTRVQMSQIRNSRVGNDQLGRTSHQIFDALGIELVRTKTLTCCSKSPHDAICRGMPVRGKLRNTTLR